MDGVRRVLIYGTLSAVVLLSVPAAASATRPATEQEVAEFRTAARKVEEITTCGVVVRGAVSSASCQWVPRADYEPVITEARVSTLEETWATAFLAPAPRTTEDATAVFREEGGTWYMLTSGNGCEPAENVPGLMPDLVVAIGCTPQIPTKVRCLDKFRTSLLALEKPRQCAVAAPQSSPFHGWMNIRELRWHEWGNEDRAWALGVIRGIPPRLRRARLSAPVTIPGVSATAPEWPPPVRLVTTGRVSCGTAYFYSSLQVVSQFGRFAMTLPTCPDQFFVPR